MAGGKDGDEYYRPWLDGIGDETGTGGDAAGDAHDAPRDDRITPKPTPIPGISSNTPAGPSMGERGAAFVAGTKRAWSAFAARTIAWGERADVPARVAAWQLGEKSSRAGAALADAAIKAGQATATATVKAGKSGAEMIGKAGRGAGRTAGAVGRSTQAGMKKGLDSSLAATKAGGTRIAAGAKQASRPMIDRVAPPKPDRPVVGDALDRLVESESDQGAMIRRGGKIAGDLPLFGDIPPSAAASRAENTTPPLPIAANAPAPRKPAREKALSASGPPQGERAPQSPRSENIGESGPDPERVPTNRIVIGGIAIAVLVVAVLAGSSLWGRGGTADTSSIAAITPTGRVAASVAPARRAEIEAVVEAYILDHPELIPQALDRLQARETGAAIAKLQPAIERPFAGAWAGNAKGDVVVTEYSDFACTFCRRSLPDVARLIKTDANVKIVYRELPILTAQSSPAAKVALAAARKGNYRIFHDTLFALGQPSDANILIAAQKAGMNADDVAAAKADPALDREIASNVSVAQQLRFEGTPSFVVGDQVLHGAVGYEALKNAVDKARAAG